MTIKYRPDIDGLRAIAVVAVVLYHAHFLGFSGGFVGVDVFFVISGFLITSLLLADHSSGQLSLLRFYERRVRRIFPALYVVLSTVLVAGWWIYAPRDFARLGDSTIAAALFYANFWFWRDSGYFESDESQTPLLHTWSLSVEEQFYLAFPLALFAILRWHKGETQKVLLWAAAISFLLSAASVYLAPTATFYLLPTRAWELLIGAYLAANQKHQMVPERWSNAVSYTGIGLIFASVGLYSESTVFPGVSAVLPTLGTALVILSTGGQRSVVGRTLSSTPMVFVGKISYSLYLWHFPVLAFASYLSIDELSILERNAAILASILLSVLSWRLVEVPSRQGLRFMTPKAVLGAGTAAMVAAGTVGAAISVNDGFRSRFSHAQLVILDGALDHNLDRMECSTRNNLELENSLCAIGAENAPISFVLWGDSHGETLRSALDVSARRHGRRGVFVGASGCPPVVGVEVSNRELCREMSEAIAHWLSETPTVETVFVASRWALWTSGTGVGRERTDQRRLYLDGLQYKQDSTNSDVLRVGLARTIEMIDGPNRRIWLVGPIPEMGVNVPRTLYLNSIGIDTDAPLYMSLAKFRERQRDVLATLNALATENDHVKLIWPHKRLCDASECTMSSAGRAIYHDDNHLSRAGAMLITDLFDSAFTDLPPLR